MEQTPILSIQNLRVAFKSNTGLNEVLHGISYDLFPNEILGIVGESRSFFDYQRDDHCSLL